MQQYKSYVICTTPRSGSTLLCKLLAATRIAGNPNSHFHNPSISEWINDYDLTDSGVSTDQDLLASIFDAARQRGTGNTGIFGLRLQRKSFDFLNLQLGVLHPGLSSDIERFQAAFGKTLFIHLTRENKLEQAISHVKATQTGLWHMASDGSELERLSPPQEPVYNAEQIATMLEHLVALDNAWRDWFVAQNIKPLRINYAELSAYPNEVLTGLLDDLRLAPQAAIGIKPAVAKLADATNKEWKDRFRAHQATK